MADHWLHLRNLINTVAIVSGGILVGGALHQSLVTGTVPLTAPPTVLMLVAGAVFAAIGYRFRVEPGTIRERFGVDSDDGNADEEFEPELSPLGDGRGDGSENT